MKNKAFFLTAFFIGMFCCLSHSGSLFAQKAQQKATVKDTKPGTIATPYCDELLPVRKKELQAKANTNCQTVSTCIECYDLKLKMKICAFMVLQPDRTSKCNPVTMDEVASLEMEVSRGATADKAVPAHEAFQVEILQSTCIKSGATLEVLIPGVDLSCDRSQYTFLWEKDGQKAGHDQKIECACGKEATVRVTQTSTGAVMLKKVKLNTCDSKD